MVYGVGFTHIDSHSIPCSSHASQIHFSGATYPQLLSRSPAQALWWPQWVMSLGQWPLAPSSPRETG
jgi:hypothetical protein